MMEKRQCVGVTRWGYRCPLTASSVYIWPPQCWQHQRRSHRNGLVLLYTGGVASWVVSVKRERSDDGVARFRGGANEANQ